LFYVFLNLAPASTCRIESRCPSQAFRLYARCPSQAFRLYVLDFRRSETSAQAKRAFGMYVSNENKFYTLIYKYIYILNVIL